MQSYSMIAPELGEGIRTLKVANYLKKVGDRVMRDEPLLTLETDKAVMEIESPVSGIIKEYKYNACEEVSVGSELVVIDTSPEQADFTVSVGSSLSAPAIRVPAHPNRATANAHEQFFSPMQQRLIRSFEHSAKQVVPASIEVQIDWRLIHTIRRAMRSKGLRVAKSVEIISWATAHAMSNHPPFRSRILDNERYVTHNDCKLGIAVDCGNNELRTATVTVDCTASLDDFIDLCRFQVSSSQKMRDTITEYHSVAVSDLSSYGIGRAIPVVVYPSVATLFIGSPMLPSSCATSLNPASLVLSFDHRLVNGAEASRFLTTMVKNISRLADLLAPG